MTRLLADDLDHWADTTPDAPAITFGERRYTWAQWRERVRHTIGALCNDGVQRGDRVAFYDKNHIACVELNLAAASIGAMNVVVNSRLAPDEVAYILRDCGARTVFVGAEFVPVLEQIRADLPDLQQVVVVGGDDDGYEAWAAAAPTTPPADGVAYDDPALILYSSGTTGFPKGVMLTHHNFDAHTTANMADFDFGPGSVNMVAMPLFHVGGSSYVLLGIRAGVPSILVREPDAPSLFGALQQGATHAFLVPAVIAGILQAGPQAMQAFSVMKRVGYGASPMPLPVLRATLAAWPGTELLQVYGMTECAGVVTTLDSAAHRDTEHPERLASAGTPLPGVELRIVDPVTGDDVQPGGTGEIWVRTEQRMAGYFGNPGATADTVTADGWVRSGDLGRADSGGFVYIVDRLKDMIITGGENVYSPEVERVIAEFPDVADVAVVGVPDERWGEAVMAFVAPHPGATVDVEKLQAYLRENLAHYKCPRAVEVLPALPRNGTGKILKRDLRAPFWAGHDRNVS
ncbi:long-chain-fatty-acid--CoA ligase [Jatrophihabitans sp. YIM 134969]